MGPVKEKSEKPANKRSTTKNQEKRKAEKPTTSTQSLHTTDKKKGHGKGVSMCTERKLTNLKLKLRLNNIL